MFCSFESTDSLLQLCGLQSYKLYEHRHSNKLIEEFMLLANMSVAKKIYDVFPELAVLRCHPNPKENMLDNLVKILKTYGETK